MAANAHSASRATPSVREALISLWARTFEDPQWVQWLTSEYAA
jgi:hypothetical protein